MTTRHGHYTAKAQNPSPKPARKPARKAERPAIRWAEGRCSCGGKLVVRGEGQPECFRVCGK